MMRQLCWRGLKLISVTLANSLAAVWLSCRGAAARRLGVVLAAVADWGVLEDPHKPACLCCFA
jgi:hypothetical protein